MQSLIFQFVVLIACLSASLAGRSSDVRQSLKQPSLKVFSDHLNHGFSDMRASVSDESKSRRRTSLKTLTHQGKPLLSDIISNQGSFLDAPRAPAQKYPAETKVDSQAIEKKTIRSMRIGSSSKKSSHRKAATLGTLSSISSIHENSNSKFQSIRSLGLSAAHKVTSQSTVKEIEESTPFSLRNKAKSYQTLSYSSFAKAILPQGSKSTRDAKEVVATGPPTFSPTFSSTTNDDSADGTYSSLNYTVLQVFDSPGCQSSNLRVFEAYAQKECIPYYSNDTFQAVTYLCNGTHVTTTYYTNITCEGDFSRVTQATTELCYNIDNNANSAYFTCTQYDLPVSSNFVLRSDFPLSDDEYCDTNPSATIGYNADICFPTGDGQSITFGCRDSFYPTVTLYDSPICEQSLKLSTSYLSTGCENDYLPFNDVNGTLIGYETFSCYYNINNGTFDDSTDDSYYYDDDGELFTSLQYFGGANCATSDLNFVQGFEQNQCVPVDYNATYKSAMYSCNASYVIETYYVNGDCTGQIESFYQVATDKCYNVKNDDDVINSIYFACSFLNDIPATGNFVVKADYPLTDPFCSAYEPPSFIAYDESACFPTDDGNSISFRCQDNFDPTVTQYVGPNCVPTSYDNTTSLPTSCSADFKDHTQIGYFDFYCVSYGNSSIYDDDGYYDDAGYDDDGTSTLYTMIQVFSEGGCSQANANLILGYGQNQCISSFEDESGVYVYQSMNYFCNGTHVIETYYTNTSCTGSVESVYHVVTDKCYDVNEETESVFFSCNSLTDVPYTGNFVVEIDYPVTDTTCTSNNPVSFTAYYDDVCFPVDDGKSVSFGCQDLIYPTVTQYESSDCASSTAVNTTRFGSSCAADYIYPNSQDIDGILIGYEQYICSSINSSFADDDNYYYQDDTIATDDFERPSGYFYIQFYENENCASPTYSEGVGLDKCLLVFNEDSDVVGSFFATCDGVNAVQNVYASNDCSGVPDQRTIPVGSCTVENSTFSSIYGQSYSFLCSFDAETIPVSQTSVVTRGYESNSADCDTSVVFFNAVSADICLEDSSEEPQIPNSYYYSCSAGGSLNLTYYSNSSTCSGSKRIVIPEPTTCQYFSFGEEVQRMTKEETETYAYYYQGNDSYYYDDGNNSTYYYYGNNSYYYGNNSYYYDDGTNNTYYYANDDGRDQVYNYFQLGCVVVVPVPTVNPSPRPSNPTSFPTNPLPTKSPVGFPTLAPTKAGSTLSPTLATPILVSFVQSIVGVSYNQYLTDVSAYNLALASAIASSVPGITPQNVIDLVVSNPTASVQSSAFRFALTATSSIQTSYTISTTSSSVSTSSITNALTSSVSDGAFNNYLNYYGNTIPGAGGLSTASSSSITPTSDTSSNNSNSRGISGGEIAAAVIFSIIGAALLIYGLVYFLSPKPSTSSTAEANTGTQMAPVVSMSEARPPADVENPMVSKGNFGTVVPNPAPPAPSAPPAPKEMQDEAVNPMAAAAPVPDSPAEQTMPKEHASGEAKEAKMAESTDKVTDAASPEMATDNPGKPEEAVVPVKDEDVHFGASEGSLGTSEKVTMETNPLAALKHKKSNK